MKKILYGFLLFFSLLSLSVATPPKKLTIALDSLTNPNHAPLIIAKQRGFFKQQGLDVTFIEPTATTSALQSVANHQAEVGVTYEPEFLAQVDKGMPFVRIGTLIDKPLTTIVVLNDENSIKSIADLKGKRIGSNANNLSETMLKVLLAQHGLESKDIELVDVQHNMTQALLSHKVDAVTGIMRNVEVPSLESDNQKVVTFFPEEHGIPNYSELIFITHKTTVQDPRLPRFMAALKKAVRYLDEYPELAWQQYIKAYPKANTHALREAWFRTMPYFAEDPSNFDQPEIEKFARFMQEHHMIKTLPAVNDYTVRL